MATKKLCVKETAETTELGIANRIVQAVVGTQRVGEKQLLTIMVSDLCGGLAGPYTVSECDIETRKVSWNAL